MRRVIPFPVLLAFLLVASTNPGLTPPAIELSTYCAPAMADHTNCIGDWISYGKDHPNRTLHASAGTYLYGTDSRTYAPYDGMRIECDGTNATTFRNIGGANAGIFLQAIHGVHRLTVNDCAFDVTGSTMNYLAVIDISPEDNTPSSEITISRNRIYDGSRLGQTSDQQRQYILLLNCRACTVSKNHLSEGGRIKVGQPGHDILIEDDTVDQANDNAITVVDAGSNTSDHITIRNNLVRQPLAIGIFFGADGETLTHPALTTRDVKVQTNAIVGNWALACIMGTMPAQTKDIEVKSNTCIKTGPTAQSAAAIRMKRTNGTPPAATKIRIERNNVSAQGVDPATTSLDFGGVFFTGKWDDVRVTNNVVTSVSSRAMYFRDCVTHARIMDNQVVGGTIQIEGYVQGIVQAHSLVGTGEVVSNPATCPPPPPAP